MRNFRKIIKDASHFPLSLFETIELNKICDAAKRLDSRLAIPATSSNFSIRTKDNDFLITKSGLHKRNLNPSRFIRVSQQGIPLNPLSAKPSDETLIHAVIYQNVTSAHAVLHCHAPEFESILLKKLEHKQVASQGLEFGYFKLKGHELLKALGKKNHQEDFYLPVVQNHQDMEKMANFIENHFFHESKHPANCAFLLERHGIYCFGHSVYQAELRLEALLHLIVNITTPPLK